MLKRYEYILKDLDCANCANKIQNKIAENQDYQDVVVNFNTLKLSLKTDIEEEIMLKDVKEIIKALEPDVEVLKVEKIKDKEDNKISGRFIRLILGIIFILMTIVLKNNSLLKEIFTVMAYVVLLYRTIINSFKLLMKKTIDENFLITVSCIGAYIIGEKFEGLMVILLYEIGKVLEEKSINHTRKSISDLMDIKPEYANVKIGDEIKRVAPEEVKVGDIFVVKVGEKIPLDGVVVSGEGKLNTASLTGESKLQSAQVNDEVLSGSISEEGILEIKATRAYENSTVSKILELVENATDKKAKTETFVAKAARIYTPIVILLSLCVAFLFPLFLNIDYKESVYRALIFLVVSCPCAIAISVPLSYFSGIGKASKQGILIKGSNFLDALKNVKEIVMDKTGTLTKGEFTVEKIVSKNNEYSEKMILEYIALGESFSNHPIAKSILKAYKEDLDVSKVKDFKEISGKGIEYLLENKKIEIGNAELVGNNDVNEIGTTIFLKIDEEIIGYVVINDIPKDEAKEFIRELKKQKIYTRMFTGDNKEIALKIGKELKVDEIKYEMLPQDKYNEFEKLLKENKTDGKIAFVGDGINDSPVLALSDVGISMGGVGASSAIEASDVVIMTDDLMKINEGIKISKKTGDIIKQNLIFAIFIKILVLVLSACGVAQMWQAIFADVGVTLITIFNTLRILK